MKNKINSANVNLVNLVNLIYNYDLEHEEKCVNVRNKSCYRKPSKLGKPEIQLKYEKQNKLCQRKPSKLGKPKI